MRVDRKAVNSRRPPCRRNAGASRLVTNRSSARDAEIRRALLLIELYDHARAEQLGILTCSMRTAGRCGWTA